MSERELLPKLLVISLFSCILLPSVQLVSGMPSVRLEEVLIFGFFGLYALVKGRKIKKFFSPLTFLDYCFALLALSVALSTLYGRLFLNQPVILRDFFEFIKILKYYLFYRLTIFCGSERYFGLPDLGRFLMSFSTAAAVISIMQFFNLLYINSWLTPLYVGNYDIDKVFLHRAVGAFGNPNISGYFFAMILVLVLARALIYGREYVKKPSFLAQVFVIAAAFLLAQSRTSLVALVVGVLVVVIMQELGKESVDYRRLLVHLGYVAGGVLCILAIIFILPFDYLQDIKNTVYAHSMMARYDVWSEALHTALKSPLLGWGPAKANMLMGIDNEYLLHFRRYGLVGLSLLLWLYFGLLRVAFALSQRYYCAENKLISLFLAGTVFIVLVVGLTNSAFNNLRYMPVFWIIAGSAVAMWKFGGNFPS